MEYKIAKDEYMYDKYLEELNNVIDIINNDIIIKVLEETYNELIPFYENYEIIDQSKYDKDPVNYEKFISNIEQVKNNIELYTYENETDVVDWLSGLGVKYNNFERKEMSLEDAFIGLTGKY